MIDESDSEATLPEYHTNGELFETVSSQDIFSTLAKHLKPREQVVLRGLAEDLALGEIASKFGISYPTVLKYRRKIGELAIKLGIFRPLSPANQNGDPEPLARIDASARVPRRAKCPVLARINNGGRSVFRLRGA